MSRALTSVQEEDSLTEQLNSTTIHELAANGKTKELAKLIKKTGGKNVDAPDDEFNGMTALHWAVTKGVSLIMIDCTFFQNTKVLRSGVVFAADRLTTRRASEIRC